MLPPHVDVSVVTEWSVQRDKDHDIFPRKWQMSHPKCWEDLHVKHFEEVMASQVHFRDFIHHTIPPSARSWNMLLAPPPFVTRCPTLTKTPP